MVGVHIIETLVAITVHVMLAGQEGHVGMVSYSMFTLHFIL